MTRFAENTKVSSNRSRDEIERTLTRYGADGFLYGWQDDSAIVGFRMRGRQVRFRLPLPDRNDKSFTLTATGRARRSADQVIMEYEKAIRQRWRALALVIKAKLEAVECEITEFDEEFLAHIVLPSGGTVGDWLLPQIDNVCLEGSLPKLLPGPSQESAE